MRNPKTRKNAARRPSQLAAIRSFQKVPSGRYWAEVGDFPRDAANSFGEKASRSIKLIGSCATRDCAHWPWPGIPFTGCYIKHRFGLH
jgi:hypothetical protein